MGKRIACICGARGRVQHQRMQYLADKYLDYLDVFDSDSAPDLGQWDIIYYTSHRLCKRRIGEKKILGTVTSSKYEMHDFLKFNGISANNKKFAGHIKFVFGDDRDIHLTENGVDTEFWCPGEKPFNIEKVVIGWVGNKDRSAKRFDRLKKLRDMFPEYEWRPIVTSKHDKGQRHTREQMREYYRGLDVCLVTSESEGTPNPALEALACGVPVLSTPVGNMLDIECVLKYDSPDEFKEQMDRVLIKKPDLSEIKKWDWSVKVKQWDKFFRSYM